MELGAEVDIDVSEDIPQVFILLPDYHYQHSLQDYTHVTWGPLIPWLTVNVWIYVISLSIFYTFYTFLYFDGIGRSLVLCDINKTQRDTNLRTTSH